MNITNHGAYIEYANKVKWDGDFISFEDEDNLKVLLTPEVIEKLYRVLHPGEFS